MEEKLEGNTHVPDDYRSASRKEMLAFLPSSFNTILEIGCGEGAFRANLSLEVEYWGVEPETAAVSIANRTFPDSNFICGLFPQEESKLPDDYYDVIVCNDIIEHVDNTDGLFHFLKKKLKHDGVLIASIPNVRHICHLKECYLRKTGSIRTAVF